MLVERQHADVVGFGSDEEFQLAAVWADIEGKQFACEMEAKVIVLFLGFGFATKTFEMALKGVVPVDSGIAQKLAGTIGKPRGEFFVFEVRIGLVDGREKAGVREFACEGLMVLIFLTLGIPDHPNTTKPLAESVFLLWGGEGLKAKAHQHDLQLHWSRRKSKGHDERSQVDAVGV